MTVGTPSFAKRACKISNSLQVGNSRQPVFFRPQMELLEEGAILQRGHDHALAERRDRLRNDAHARLIFFGEEKRARERAVNAVPEHELGVPQPREEFPGEIRSAVEFRPEQAVPEIRRITGHRRRRSACAVRHAFAPDFPATAIFGAAVKPAAAPMPSISSQRGQVFATFPWSARSITSLDMRSTTRSK